MLDVGSVLLDMTIAIFVWWSTKGRYYGNQLNLGDVHRHRQERSLLFAVAFDNRLADREATFKRLNGNNPATFLPRFGCNLTTIFIRHVGVAKRIAILISEQ